MKNIIFKALLFLMLTGCDTKVKKTHQPQATNDKIEAPAGIPDSIFGKSLCYSGLIQTDKGKRLEIELSMVILSDTAIIGSYCYNSRWGHLKIDGNPARDLTFRLTERSVGDHITGFFRGRFGNDLKTATGTWTDGKEARKYTFKMTRIKPLSHQNYIQRYRALYEFNDLRTAILKRRYVLCVDVSEKGLMHIPKAFGRLDNIVSLNLLANNFRQFPIVVTRLKTLEELSLSSNKLEEIDPAIGKLSNLKVLCLNFNRIERIPQEIGDLNELLYLDLGYNRLTALPEEIKYLTRLEELHVNSNNLNEKEKQKIRLWLPHCKIHF